MGGQLGEMSLMVDEYKSRVGNLSVYIGLLDLFPAISSLKEITPSSGVEGLSSISLYYSIYKLLQQRYLLTLYNAFWIVEHLSSTVHSCSKQTYSN